MAGLLYHFYFQCTLDINFNHEIPVTFKLVEGNGPVHITGQQLVGEWKHYHTCQDWFPGTTFG